MLNWKNLNGKKYLHFVPDEECTCIYVDVPICAILYEGYKTCLISSGDFIILKPIGQKSFSLKSEYSGVLTYMAKEWEMHGVLFSDTESDLLYIDTSESSIMEYKKWIDELENRRAINKIKEKLLAKKRKQDLEKAALQELMDEGEIFPEANKRPPIPKEVVDVVWRRDGGKCVYCGSTENLQLDHIIPFSKGGATTVENLQLLCQKCNLQKSNKNRIMMKEYIAIFEYNGEIQNLEFVSNSNSQEKLNSEARMYVNDYLLTKYGTVTYHFIRVIPK